MTPAATFTVRWSHGQATHGIEDYASACAAVRLVFPDASIGHDGDLDDGGDSTLCWPDESSAENDDGVRACAKIVRVWDAG